MMRAMKRAIRAAIVSWPVTIVGVVTIAGLLSLGTSSDGELPKWNGIDYLLFSMKEGLMLSPVIATALSVFVFLVFGAAIFVQSLVDMVRQKASH